MYKPEVNHRKGKRKNRRAKHMSSRYRDTGDTNFIHKGGNTDNNKTHVKLMGKSKMAGK